MALEMNAGELASAALSGGAAVELTRAVIDFVKGRRARRKEDEDTMAARAASDAELLHQSEVEFRRALLQRIQQLERHDQQKSARIQQLEEENSRLATENRRLSARIAQLESSHGPA